MPTQYAGVESRTSKAASGDNAQHSTTAPRRSAAQEARPALRPPQQETYLRCATSAPKQQGNTTTSPGQARHIAQASPRNVTAFFALFFSALANRVGKLTLMYRPSGTWYRLPIRASGDRRDRAPATGENLLPLPPN